MIRILLICTFVFSGSFSALAQTHTVSNVSSDVDRAMCFVSNLHLRNQAINYMLGSGSILTAGSIVVFIQRESVRESWSEILTSIMNGKNQTLIETDSIKNLGMFLNKSLEKNSTIFQDAITTYRSQTPEALGFEVFRDIPEITGSVQKFEILLPDAREAYQNYLTTIQDPEVRKLIRKQILGKLNGEAKTQLEQLRLQAKDNLMADHRYKGAFEYAKSLETWVNDVSHREKISTAIYNHYDLDLFNEIERNAAKSKNGILDTYEKRAMAEGEKKLRASSKYRSFMRWNNAYEIMGMTSLALIVSGAIVHLSKEATVPLTDDILSKDLHGVRIYLEENPKLVSQILRGTKKLSCQINYN